jgi:hypothetical protein
VREVELAEKLGQNQGEIGGDQCSCTCRPVCEATLAEKLGQNQGEIGGDQCSCTCRPVCGVQLVEEPLVRIRAKLAGTNVFVHTGMCVRHNWQGSWVKIRAKLAETNVPVHAGLCVRQNWQKSWVRIRANWRRPMFLYLQACG